jgi:hypothetical protein
MKRRGKAVAAALAGWLMLLAPGYARCQSLSATLRNPAANFASMKSAWLALGGPVLGNVEAGTRRHPRSEFAFLTCRGADFYISDNYLTEDASVVAAVAYEAAVIEHGAAELHYPKAVWQPIVDRYVRAQLARIGAPAQSRDDYGDDPVEARLKRDLIAGTEAYARAHPELHLGKMVDGRDGCGAGENDFKILTQPAAALVELIPNFFYTLCVAKHINPEDTTKCDKWIEAFPSVNIYLAGDYRYLIRWSDGVVRRGLLSADSIARVENPQADGNGQPDFIVTIAKP